MSYPDRFSERVAQATTAEEIRDILKDEVGLSMTDALMLVSQHARVFDRPLLMLILVIDRANPALALNPHLVGPRSLIPAPCSSSSSAHQQ